MKFLLKPQVKTALAIVWLAFTFSLVGWWWIYFLLKFDTDSATIEQMQVSHRMFVWEGSILLAAILFGGIALVLFTYRDQKRHQRLRFFFATFSHDIKTSIARLRLQAEVLEEDLRENTPPVMRRLLKDIQRLDLQLENSLSLATLETGGITREPVALSDILSSLRSEFSDISVELVKDAYLRGDRRALISVFKNLIQNSLIHGNASAVSIKVKSVSTGKIEVQITDNGLGFKGPLEKLGSEILKSQDTRSNGIGLLITKRLIERMKGSVQFSSSENSGFTCTILIQGDLK